MATNEQPPLTIAFVLYPGLTMLDLVATQSVIKGLEADKRYHLTTVGERQEPIVSDTPLKVVPDLTFAGAPQPYGLFLPGAGLGSLFALGNPALCDYVRRAAGAADLVVGLSTGALILAGLGLLEGREATTHWAYAGLLERLGARPVQKRWVRAGKVITTAGGTAGMDMALALLATLKDETAARMVQTMAEYDPEPPFGGIAWEHVDREALAPRLAQHREQLQRALASQPALLDKLGLAHSQVAL